MQPHGTCDTGKRRKAKREFRLVTRINALESRVNTQIGEPRERMTHLVGLLEALRETITGRVAS